MSRRRLPTPTLRKGALTYEVRFRHRGKIVTRSLGSRDYDEAVRRVPAMMEAVYRSETMEAARPSRVDAPPKRLLSAADVCEIYRREFLESEEQSRMEAAAGGVRFATERAAQHKRALERGLEDAQARALLRDYGYEAHFIDRLEGSGVGAIEDRGAALRALSLMRIRVLREVMAADQELCAGTDRSSFEVGSAGPLQPSATTEVTSHANGRLLRHPSLSQILEDYIAERRARMTDEVINDHRAIVRDFCEVVGDRPLGSYGKEDGRTFKEALLVLPANWRKLTALRGLTISEACQKSKELGLARQKAKTILIKRGMLRAVFDFAQGNYDGVKNPFSDNAAWVVADASHADQRDAFQKDELERLLKSDMSERLHWLTWLGLLTGARLNELCQLTADLVRTDGPYSIWFSPELRLKTKQSSGSSVRSVPLHPKLLELGFLEYVEKCRSNQRGQLFPDIPVHRTGRLSDSPSKAFRRHLQRLGLKRPGLSFHSLRHTFIAEFRRRAAKEVETRERLVGHHIQGVAGRYGNSYESEALDLELIHERAKVISLLFPSLAVEPFRGLASEASAQDLVRE